MNKLFSAVLTTAAILGTSPIHADVERIGSVRQVHVAAYGTPPDSTRHKLSRRDPIYQDELIETVQRGWAQLRFNDRSTLRITSSTSITLDRFIYDRNTRTGEMAVDISKGIMRFVSGRMNPQGSQFRTPTAIIGIRGTDVVISVRPQGLTTVYVRKGEVDVQALASAERVIVGRYKAVTIGTNGEIDSAPYLVPANPGLGIHAGPTAIIDGAGGDGGGAGGGAGAGGTGGGQGD